MAYAALVVQRRLRERLQVAVVTKFKPNMVLPEEFEDAFTMTCEQGQELRWLGLHERDQQHWFGVTEPEPLCSRCWQQSTCPRQFSFPPHRHEILYGTIPFSSSAGQKLLRQARSWVEATQSYEKNQLGLNQFFLNSLRLTWVVCLLADTVALLRATAMITNPKDADLLAPMRPKQMHFDQF